MRSQLQLASSALGALLLAAPSAVSALPAQQTTTALVGARILPVSGPEIDAGVVLISAGKITAVLPSADDVPNGATVVDVSGRWITPGLVDAATNLGLADNDLNEQGDEITPQVRVVDALDPADPRFDRVRRRGVTTVQINPGNRNVFGGLGAVVKTDGDTLAEMLLRDESGLRLTFGREPGSGNRAMRFGAPTSIYYRRPTTRMGVIWEARKAFYDAKEYRETVQNGGQPPQADPALETLVRALDGEVRIRSTARTEADIRTALRLAREFNYETLIEEATEAWRVVEELRDAGSTVLIAAPSAERVAGSGAQDGAEPRWSTLNLLAANDVPFAICTGANLASLDLVHEAMFAVRHGLDRGTALAAVTRVPARILGIDDQVGALEPGLDADLVVWSGDPFDPTTRAERVYVRGQSDSE